jgi:hypothetical protein
MDEGYKLELRLVAELLAAWCFNGTKKFASNVFLFLVYFVIL